MNLDILSHNKDFICRELAERGQLIIKRFRLSVKHDVQFIMYQTLCISLVHKSKHKKKKIKNNILSIFIPKLL